MWKNCNLILLEKKGNPHDPLNYRPIALLNSMYKIYSQILCARFTGIITKNNILSSSQFGFYPGRNINMAHKSYHQILEDAKFNDKDIFVIYIDFAKAYDSVEYWALNKALKHQGFNNSWCKTVMSLFRDLRSTLKIPVGSDSFRVEKGVRQGDGFSPILFTSFLNPIIKEIENSGLGYKMRWNVKCQLFFGNYLSTFL